MRDGQSTTFDQIYASGAFDSRELLILTLKDDTVLYLSDVPVTVGGQDYQPDIREPGELQFSEGGNTDGMKVSLQNADSSYSLTDEDGVSPLEGASYVYKKAISYPGQNSWETDELDDGVVRNVEADQLLAPMTLVSDIYDPTKTISGRVVTLEEMTPVAEAVTTAGGGMGGGGDTRDNGWGDGSRFDIFRDARMDRAY